MMHTSSKGDADARDVWLENMTVFHKVVKENRSMASEDAVIWIPEIQSDMRHMKDLMRVMLIARRALITALWTMMLNGF